MNKKNKKILLTGGAGYIGSHVCNLLLDNGFEVTVVDNLVTGNEKLISTKAKFINCDISDNKKINSLLENDNFFLVMHFAGLTRVDESIKHPEKYFEYNFEKAKIFLKSCINNNLKKIIFSSTAAVYGNPNESNVKEDSKLNPLNPYLIQN